MALKIGIFSPQLPQATHKFGTLGWERMLGFLLVMISQLLFLVAVLSSVYLLAAAVSTYRFKAGETAPQPSLTPVTILKPLCGDEPNLKEHLRSFCLQDYPTFQIVFGVQDADDKALDAVRSLIEEFKNVDIAVVVDHTRLSHNLKVANLQNMLAAAKYDYLVMADSDTRVKKDYLTSVSGPLGDPSVGAVTCIYRGISDGGFWSTFGCMHINFGFLPQAILADMLGMGGGCFGATIAMRRDMLERIGGFSTIGNMLADDHELGLHIRRHNKKVILSRHVIDSMISENSLKSLFRHETRWARTIHMVHPSGYIGSLFTHPTAFAVLALAFNPFFQQSFYGLAGVLSLRFLTALFGSRTLGLSKRLFWTLPVRDLLSFAVFLNGFFYGTVKWRTNTFRVGANGRITLDEDFAA